MSNIGSDDEDTDQKEYYQRDRASTDYKQEAVAIKANAQNYQTEKLKTSQPEFKVDYHTKGGVQIEEEFKNEPTHEDRHEHE